MHPIYETSGSGRPEFRSYLYSGTHLGCMGLRKMVSGDSGMCFRVPYTRVTILGICFRVPYTRVTISGICVSGMYPIIYLCIVFWLSAVLVGEEDLLMASA